MVRAERVGHIICSYRKNYAKRISNNIAAALVVYTLLLIFIATPAMDSGASIWPFFFLVLLVVAVIPFFRNMDKRWQALDRSEVSSEDLEGRFAFDRIKLWTLTLAIPIALTVFCKLSSFAV
jgi:fatty acid desaturase